MTKKEAEWFPALALVLFIALVAYLHKLFNVDEVQAMLMVLLASVGVAETAALEKITRCDRRGASGQVGVQVAAGYRVA